MIGWSRCCFNGAGLIQPGRRHCLPRTYKRFLWASMGPGLFSPEDSAAPPPPALIHHCFNGAGLIQPGRLATSRQYRRSAISFNGAGLIQPGRRCLALRSNPKKTLLQWGRAYSARKTAAEHQRQLQQQRASMGPGLFSPEDKLRTYGKEYSATRFNGAGLVQPGRLGIAAFEFVRTRLQWGRACSARKTDYRPVGTLHCVGLQWGRACSARKTTTIVEDPLVESVASMGPGLFSPEDAVGGLANRLGWIASMGPGLFSPEDHCERNRVTSREARFNGAGLVQPGRR